MSRIAIIGGHGKVALHLSRILTGQGHQVSALIRNPDHAADVRDAGAAPVVTDVETATAEELTDQLRGHDAVVWSAGAGGGNPDRTYAVDRDAAIRSMDAASAAGVQRYIMVSYLGAGKDHGVPEDNSFFPYAEAKAAADEYLKSSSLDWTILGPSALTLEPATGKIQAGPGTQGGQVSRENVAMVAAEVLAVPSTTGKVIEFINGSTPISQAIREV
ncbi:SDR family oxidoreductase [Arthrobacter sp. CAU 1506]|uniref:SDR family oxidoreductase n=1 Tax=Arthrobacter sp. CAU 1506 TaxID=2560052 RepID=UPI0010AD618A|nr:SDR family oxidoreductase [Arthrobacter sp. CAU 1506]TJY66338.1 SDR family oxidoreductase [Arthrobacter sp. CAU 1506]